MKRGELWTVSRAGDYAGKPRPAIVLQGDAFRKTASVTVCPLTTNPTEAPLLRLAIAPSATNGLRMSCRAMVDKITTLPRSRTGERIGRLSDDDIVRLNRAVMVFLGLAG